MSGASGPPLVGLDLDNTIVSYDGLFHRLAAEADLIPSDLPAEKNAVRDHLRASGREDAWTELQGQAYGARMSDAVAFDGVREFLARCDERGVGVYVVSHRSRHPYRGPRHDLHEAALQWLESNGFFGSPLTGLERERVFLEETLDAKAERVSSLGCTHFVDDLPEFLAQPKLADDLVRVLFDPSGRVRLDRALHRAASWNAVAEIVLGDRGGTA